MAISETNKVWQRLCGGFFSKHNYLYSATAAEIVQPQLHEPCSVNYFASFYVRQISCSFLPPPPSHRILATPLFWSCWMFVYTMQPVVQPVVKPVEAGCRAAWIKQVEFIQPVEQPVECLHTRYNRLCRVNGVSNVRILFRSVRFVRLASFFFGAAWALGLALAA